MSSLTQSKKPVYIYALVDPEDNSVFYIGKSENPKSRLSAHLALSKTDNNRHKKNKIAKIKRLGNEPSLVILEKCCADDWKEKERKWIARGRKEKWPLTNIKEGGESTAEDYMNQVVAPYLNPTKEDFSDAITKIVHPNNHDAIKSLDFDGLVELGKRIVKYLFST